MGEPFLFLFFSFFLSFSFALLRCFRVEPIRVLPYPTISIPGLTVISISPSLPSLHLLRWILHTMGDPEEDDEVIDLLADSDYEEDSMME